MPMAPRPGAVAMATMVSIGENNFRLWTLGSGLSVWSLGRKPEACSLRSRARYLRAEIVTVFVNASPMLSV
jgi:hypothetical protein